MASFLERRRFNRIFVSLPVEYQARLSDTNTPCQGQGYLRDISLSGIYFHIETDLSFQQGQILSLSISVSAPMQYLESHDISHLRAIGEVIRFDPPEPDRPLGGVALNFLEGPTFISKADREMFQGLN
jgi:c-di-GMP-binding flagellar brake protein YcgR